MRIATLPRTLLNAGELCAVGARIHKIFEGSTLTDEHLSDLLEFIKTDREAIIDAYGAKDENVVIHVVYYCWN